MNIRPLNEKRADFFRYLNSVVRYPGFNPEDVPIDLSIGIAVDIWEYNPSSECTFDNLHRSCKSKYLYLLVTSDSQFDPVHGVELGPSYGMEVTAITYRNRPSKCVLFKIRERVPARGSQGLEMQVVDREVCISARGLMR